MPEIYALSNLFSPSINCQYYSGALISKEIFKLASSVKVPYSISPETHK